MSKMLERAARAAYDELARQNDEAGELLFIGDGALLARAVLMAVRVPGSDVVESGMIAGEFSGMADTAFTAMIDAILSESSE